LARAEESDVRELAAVLGIRYRQLPSGVFSHSAVITLLDADGIVRARTENLQTLDPDFMRAVSQALE
jgi:protein SCO1/2